MSDVERPDWTPAPPATVPAASVPVAGADVDSELAEIATFRREDRRAYFKDEKMQARELELLRAKENGPPAQAPENVMAPADVVPNSIFALPEDVGPETAPALDMAKAVLAEDASWSNTIAGFTEHLSTTAQNVLVEEMARMPDMEAGSLTPNQIVQFTRTPEGRELWDEWGPNAPEKASMARARLSRLVDSLPEHEVSSFDALFEALPPAAFKEAMRQMAGG